MIIDEKARWAAKYPFDKEALDFLKDISLSIDEFIEGEYRDILNYAYKRVLGELKGEIKKNWDNDYIESVSHYLAILIIAATKNIYLYRRFAEAEAKRIYFTLREDSYENLLKVGKNLGLRVYQENDMFKIFFLDFIRISRGLSSIHWRLYNHELKKGYVSLNKRKFARLLTQAVRDKIFNMVSNVKVIPVKIENIANKLIEELGENIKIPTEEERFEEAEERDYPPCIKFLMKNVDRGLSHPGRFTLVTFLSSVGYSLEEIVNIFRTTPDFNEKMTRYQVEHILGMRGSRIKYIVPSCKKIRSYGYCFPDELCRRYNIKHPLNYVRIIRRRRMRDETKR